MLSPDKAAPTLVAAEPKKPAPPRFKLLSSAVIPLTTEVLQEFSKIESGTLEREKSAKRVRHLLDKAMAGQLVTFHWVTAHIKSLNKTVRGNGFHSSDMLNQLLAQTGALPDNLKVLKEHFEVEDGDRFAELFQQYDDRASARQADDVAGVYMGLHPELADVNKKIGKLAIDGYVWHMRYVEGVKDTPVGDMSYSTFGDKGLYPFIHWLAEILNGKTKELRRREIVAAMFATFGVNESAARLFWDEVSRAGNPDEPDLPQTALDAWLLSMSDGKIDKVTPKEYYEGCIYAWNASRDDRRVTSIRHNVKKNVTTPRA